MNIEVNFSRRFLVFGLILGLISLGFAGVYAYNSAGTGGNPVMMGHSMDEINWSKQIPKINATTICISGDCRSSWMPSQFPSSCPMDQQVLRWSGSEGQWKCSPDSIGVASVNNEAGAVTLDGIGGISISKMTSGASATIYISSPSQINSLTCSNGQIPKWAGTAWSCGADTDTDTKCSTSGACSQVCIGSDCRTSWSAPASGITSVNGATGPAVTLQGSGTTTVSRSGNTITLGISPVTCVWKGKTWTPGARCRSVYYCPITDTPYWIMTCNANGQWTATNEVKKAYQDCPVDPCS